MRHEESFEITSPFLLPDGQTLLFSSPQDSTLSKIFISRFDNDNKTFLIPQEVDNKLFPKNQAPIFYIPQSNDRALLVCKLRNDSLKIYFLNSPYLPYNKKNKGIKNPINISKPIFILSDKKYINKKEDFKNKLSLELFEKILKKQNKIDLNNILLKKIRLDKNNKLNILKLENENKILVKEIYLLSKKIRQLENN